MQKKIIALALASLATGAAFAQSNVTIYGRADMGAMYRGHDSGAVANTEGQYEFGSGLQSGSRIGFKGVEDLGNGLKAIFELEYGIGVDQRAAGQACTTTATTNAGVAGACTNSAGTAATWVNRHSYVGLTGGFGTAVAGRLDGVRYGVFNSFDPFAGGTVGNFTQMTVQVDRADNAVAYISPKFGGFGVVLAYGTNITGAETAANNADNSLETVMLTYDNGPIAARLDWEQVATPGTLGNRAQVITGAFSYDLGVVKLSALLDQIKNSNPDATLATLKQNAWLVGAKAPVGKFTIKAMVGGVMDKSLNTAGVDVAKNNSMKWALGTDYALSKRTNLYFDYGQIHNQTNATRTITSAANSNAGYGTMGFDMGIAHNF